MITIDKVKIFSKFNGDGDMWSRSDNPEDKLIDYKEWSLIDNLIQDFTIVQNGFASLEFLTAFNNNLTGNFEDQETIELFKTLPR